MRKASITEAKNNLSALIDSVKGGTAVLIMDRGRPVARLEPVMGEFESNDERLARLVRDGVVRPGGGNIPDSIINDPPPRLQGKTSVLQLLLEERREGR
jgi:prevent-host-death family protein